MEHWHLHNQDNQSMSIISDRECQILELLSFGLSSQEMADRLVISKETVRTHRKALLLKLNAKNSAHLIRRGFEFGMISQS